MQHWGVFWRVQGGWTHWVVEFNADGYLGIHFKTQGKKSYAHLSSRSKHPMSCSTVGALVIYHCCSAQSRRVVREANGMLARHYFDWFIGSRIHYLIRAHPIWSPSECVLCSWLLWLPPDCAMHFDGLCALPACLSNWRPEQACSQPTFG